MSCSAVQSWRTATCRKLKCSVQSSRGLIDPIFLRIYFSKLEPGAQWYCLSCLAHSYQQRALVMDSITVLLLFPQYLPAATARHSPTCLFMSLFHRHENKQNDSHSLTLRSQQWNGMIWVMRCIWGWRRSFIVMCWTHKQKYNAATSRLIFQPHG